LLTASIFGRPIEPDQLHLHHSFLARPHLRLLSTPRFRTFGASIKLSSTKTARRRMAITPLSPRENMAMPMPPPLLHTRSGNEAYDRPQTPTGNAFVSPSQTPVGSPSKKQLPPGAADLPNVFDNALKLNPSSPTKPPTSPSRLALADDSILRQDFGGSYGRSESPTRGSNKENAPSGDGRFNQSHAALSRRGQYESVDTKRNIQTRGLTAEELQKLQNPKLKRLANVTQLCKFGSGNAIPS